MVLLLAPLGFFGYAAYAAYGKSAEAEQKKLSVQDELSRIETRETALVADLERLESERGTEEALRARYRVGREGEQVVMLIDNTPVPEPELPLAEPTSFWHKILAIVF